MDEDPLAGEFAAVLALTPSVWESFRGQHIFVTGGTGFFGRWLLGSFAHANNVLGLEATLVVLSRDPAAFLAQVPHLTRDPAIRFVQGDVTTFTVDDVRRQLGSGQTGAFSYVINAATDTSATWQAANPRRLLDVIVQGTRATLDFAVAAGARRFLLTSSGAVYGRQPPEVTHLPEDFGGAPDTMQPTSVYGEGKRLAESLCVCYHQEYGLETMIARCFAFVGPFLPLHAHFAIGNFIRDALRGEPIKIAGDGTPFRSYLYAADLAAWLWTILAAGRPLRPYNVGSGADLSILDLARAVSAALNVPARVEIAIQPHAGAAPSRYVPDVQRAESELGLRVNTALPEAIAKTARWAAEHDPGVRVTR